MRQTFPRLPDAQERALLLLRLLEIRNEELPAVSRVRLSELTLKRLWGRDRISRDLLDDTQEWLSRGGWTLFYARTTYAAIKISAVLGWSRLSSKRMSVELEQILDGDFGLERHVHLLRDVHSDQCADD